MASRMDRYYKDELVNSGRSSKNKSLYKQIEDLDNYTNIEGVATIEKTNEIDISKVKQMLNNREDYKKRKQFSSIIKQEQEEVEQPIETIEETKNYDINDILSKAKREENSESKEHRSLSGEQYKTIKSLNVKGKDFNKKVEQELNELASTISKTRSFKELESNENNTKTLSDLTDDIGLLDELKSNTMVGDASSIRKIIEEEKQNKVDDNTSTMEIDKSFYTSSLGFTKSDFDELKDMNHKLKKGNKFIIVLLFIIIIVFVSATALFFILK